LYLSEAQLPGSFRAAGCWLGVAGGAAQAGSAPLEQPPPEASLVCVLLTPSVYVGLSPFAQGSCNIDEVGVLSKHWPWVLSSCPTPALTQLRAPLSGASRPCDF